MSDGGNVLLEWAKRGELSGAVLSKDGTVLTLHDERLDATQKVSLHHEGRSCEYTLASIFLQIVEPNQSLMAYRNKCKTHGVTDMVRATDKKTVVGYYHSASAPAGDHGFGQPPPPPPTQQLKQPPPETTVPPHIDTNAVVDAGDATKPRPLSSSSRREKSSSSSRHHDDRKRDKHHKHRKHDKRSSSKDHKRRKSSSQPPQPPPTKKKKKAAMTTAQMLSNLNVVVDKRRQLGQGDNAEIHAALSAEGFGVTPELLQEEGDPAVHQSIVSYEIPVGNSASILRPAPGRDFQRVLDLWIETTEGGGKHHKSKSAAALAKKAKARSHLVGKKPVIVLPKGMTSPLTMINAHEFFNNRKFVPRDVAMKQQQKSSSSSSSKTVLFWHKFDARRGSSLVEFELMDNPRAKLGNDPREWDRIVAVVALGAAWQFKDWPRGYNHPVDLFSRCFGFYVGLEGTKLPAAIEGWAVQRGKLNRDKRGLDSVCFATFWEGLEDRMVTKKPELIPQQQQQQQPE